MTYSAALKNRVIVIMLAGALLFSAFLFCDTAEANERVTILIDPLETLRITNGEGKYVEYEYDEYKPIGDMKLYKNDNEYEFINDGKSGWRDSSLWLIETDGSDTFTFQPTKSKCFEDFYAEIRGGIHKEKEVRALWFEKLVFNREGIDIIAEKGSSCEYYIGLLSPSDNIYYNAAGVDENDISLKRIGSRIFLEGAKGKTRIYLWKGRDVVADKYVFLFGGRTEIKKKGNNFSVSPGVSIPGKETKDLTSLYVRPANSGKNMFLTWNKVKKAKSYVVYRYDYAKKAYVKVAVRNGKSANYYNIPKADKTVTYKYKVEAKTKKNGKGKNVCKSSYSVWAVASGNVKKNAAKVTVNKKSIKGKRGKKVRLKAAVKAAGNGSVLSTKVRWYTDNGKIATVSKNGGKVKLKRKGTCHIWAKAHNGVNSKKIKITVR